jgi:hypothetical protein
MWRHFEDEDDFGLLLFNGLVQLLTTFFFRMEHVTTSVESLLASLERSLAHFFADN